MRRALSARDWAAIAAVTVVTFLAASTVTVMVAPRHDRPGLVANKAGLETPTPAPSPSSAPTPIAEKASDVQLTAPSAAVVWALVDYDSLFVSVDSGAHWDKRSMPANFGVRPSISFISPAEGWLLAPGSPATQCQAAQADVWHTTDGAKTWQQVNGGFSEAQCKESVWFVDSQHGFVTAWDQNHRPTVYHTSDGGYHWAPATVPDNPIFVTGAGGFTLRVGWIKSFGKTVYLEASGTQHDPTWPRDFIYISLYFVMIIGFAYFYTAISFDPHQQADYIKKQGGYIPGIRPGPPTER